MTFSQACSVLLTFYDHIHVYQFDYLDSKCHGVGIYCRQHYMARFPVVDYLSSPVASVMDYRVEQSLFSV